MPRGRRHDVSPGREEVAPQVERQGEGMDADRGREPHTSRGASGVDRVFAGGNEVDHTQIVPRAEEPAVGLGELTGLLKHLVRSQGQLESGVLAGPVEPGDVIVRPERPVAERAGHLGHGRPDDDAQIVDIQLGLRRGDELTVQIDDRLGHGVVTPWVVLDPSKAHTTKSTKDTKGETT